MKRFLLYACLPVVLLASCGRPAPAPHRTTPAVQQVATAIPTALPAAATAPARGEAIRFALVGEPAGVNAWALFDESGAGYASRALHAGEYPALYRLSDPGREFEPYIADGMPSVVTQEGEYLTATVRLREGLTWGDGSPLTARDVSFTVDRALSFHLGLDWVSAYDPEVLAGVEALDDLTVKFLFKGPFDVGDWQYGALQGPVLSEAYWSPKLAEAEALLPAGELTADLEKLQAEAKILQERLDADNALLLTLSTVSEDYGETSARVKRNQDELNSVNFRLGKLQDKNDAALNAARSVLFALEEAGEPTFGPFLRAVQDGDEWVRELNPYYPFQKPNYDRAAYSSFPDVSSALAALQAAEADEVLSLEGVPAEAATQSSPTSSMRFLAFNPKSAELASPALRLAIACLRGFRETTQDDPGSNRLYGFVPNEPWQNRDPLFPCSDMSEDFKLETAVRVLSEAGYSWSTRPDRAQAGTGLLMPGGAPFPTLTLLSPPAEDDLARARTASLIEMQANYLGIPLTVQWTDPESLRYAVYSSGEYDLAILGWRLGAYPGYLCEWFQPPGAFAYPDAGLRSACDRLESTADLATARLASYEIQSILMEDLPFIPLYQVMRYEAAGKIRYPFDPPLDGFSGMYGAPWLAAPLQ